MHPYALDLFAGRMTENNIEDILSFDHVRFGDAYLVGAGLSARLFSYRDLFQIEIEGQIDRHFDAENLWEFTLPLTFRWKSFPWNDVVRTSIAYGIGPSYTTKTPPAEVALNGESQQFLLYWVAELELGPPDEPWSGTFRVHHRSTGFKAVGSDGGSNWLVLGIKRRF